MVIIISHTLKIVAQTLAYVIDIGSSSSDDQQHSSLLLYCTTNKLNQVSNLLRPQTSLVWSLRSIWVWNTSCNVLHSTPANLKTCVTHGCSQMRNTHTFYCMKADKQSGYNLCSYAMRDRTDTIYKQIQRRHNYYCINIKFRLALYWFSLFGWVAYGNKFTICS